MKMTTHQIPKTMRRASACLLGLGISAMTLLALAAHAQTTYTWIQTAGAAQNWTTPGNWSGGSAPSPVSGDTVDFSTIALSADTTLTLGADRTATTWKFGDTSASHNWTVNSGNNLISAGTSPVLNVLQGKLTLNNALNGTNGCTINSSGSGTLILNASNSLSGAVTVSGGTVVQGNTNALPGSLTLSNSAILDLHGVSPTTQFYPLNGSGTVDNLSSTPVTLTVQQATIAVPFSGVIQNSSNGVVSLAKRNTTIWAATGNSTFDGQVQILSGTISVNAVANKGTPSPLGRGNTNSAIYIGNGANTCGLQYTGSGHSTDRLIQLASAYTGNQVIDASGTGALQFTNTGSWLATVTAGHPVTLQGSSAANILNLIASVIPDATNNGSCPTWLTKAGTNTWVLSGINTYSGWTTISGGTLQIGGAGTLGAGSYNSLITNNATLEYSSSANQTFSNTITGAGALIKDTSTTSKLRLTAGNTYTGPTTVSAGTLQIDGAGYLGNGADYTNTITIGAGATLEYSSSVNSIFDTTTYINGLGTLVKDTSANSLTLTSSNNIAAIKILAGTLGVRANNNALGTAATTITLGDTSGANDATLYFWGGSRQFTTKAGLIVASGSSGTKTIQYGNGAMAYADNTPITLNDNLTVQAFYSGASLALGGAISGPGGITANPLVPFPFTLTLSGTNSYTGPTDVSYGTLLVNGDSSQVTNTLTVEGTAILGGNGKIGGNVAFASGATALFTNGATLAISGSLTLDGNNFVQLYLPTNYGPATNVLATYNPTGSSGAFDSAPVLLSGSFAAGTTNFITTSGGQVTLVVKSFATAPSPTNITVTASSGQMVLNWPDGQGWQLQSNSVSLTDTNSWFPVTGATPPFTNNINPTIPYVFFRLKY
jgi:fibronectin-binding autotransporter adhesin